MTPGNQAAEEVADLRKTAAAILTATSSALNPSPDISGCPTGVARLTIPTVLRAYADAEHHFGEGIRQPVDYGTGTEYDAMCACGASWGEDGCTERERLLAVAAQIEGRGDD